MMRVKGTQAAKGEPVASMLSTVLDAAAMRPGGPALKAVLNAPGAAYLLVLLALWFGLAGVDFFSAGNLVNVGLQASVLMIIAAGMTLVILTEGIDLSLGPLLGLAAVVFAWLVTRGHPIWLAVLAVLAVSMSVGTINGALVAYASMPPFIVTLAMFGVCQSLAMVLTGGTSITGLPEAFSQFNEGLWLGVPYPVLTSALVFALSFLLLYRTRFGRYVFAIGGNRSAVLLSGVPVRVYHTLVYVYAAVLTGLAALILTARMNAGHPTFGVGIEFDAIAAVVLGGTSFEKGRGGLAGTVVGVLAVTVLRNGLNLVGVAAEWQVATIGIVIIATVGLDTLRGRV